MFDPTDLLLQWGPHHGPHYGPMDAAGGAGGYLGGPVWLLLSVVVLVALTYLALRVVGSLGAETGPDEAFTTLRRRYARGEVDDEEFDRRRERLARTGR
jgi:putative membrane protein